MVGSIMTKGCLRCNDKRKVTTRMGNDRSLSITGKKKIASRFVDIHPASMEGYCICMEKEMSFGIKQAGVAKWLRRPLPIKRLSNQPVAGDCGFDPHRWFIFCFFTFFKYIYIYIDVGVQWQSVIVV